MVDTLLKVLSWRCTFLLPKAFKIFFSLLQEIVARTGLPWASLILFGGVLYSIGAAAYALKWPNPYPKTFGYHGEHFNAPACKSAAYLLPAV